MRVEMANSEGPSLPITQPMGVPAVISMDAILVEFRQSRESNQRLEKVIQELDGKVEGLGTAIAGLHQGYVSRDEYNRLLAIDEERRKDTAKELSDVKIDIAAAKGAAKLLATFAVLGGAALGAIVSEVVKLVVTGIGGH